MAGQRRLFDEHDMRRWAKANPRVAGGLLVSLGGAAVYWSTIRPYLRNGEMWLGVGLIGTMGFMFGMLPVVRGRVSEDNEITTRVVAHVLAALFLVSVFWLMFFGERFGFRFRRP